MYISKKFDETLREKLRAMARDLRKSDPEKMRDASRVSILPAPASLFMHPPRGAEAIIVVCKRGKNPKILQCIAWQNKISCSEELLAEVFLPALIPKRFIKKGGERCRPEQIEFRWSQMNTWSTGS